MLPYMYVLPSLPTTMMGGKWQPSRGGKGHHKLEQAYATSAALLLNI